MSVCDLDALSRYLDGDMSLPGRRALEAHMTVCPPCSLELDTMRRLDTMVVSYGMVQEPIPLQTEREVLRKVQRRRRVKPIVRVARMMPAAVGTTVAAVLVLLSANLGILYHSHPVGNASALATATHRVVERQSAPLWKARRTTA